MHSPDCKRWRWRETSESNTLENSTDKKKQSSDLNYGNLFFDKGVTHKRVLRTHVLVMLNHVCRRHNFRRRVWFDHRVQTNYPNTTSQLSICIFYLVEFTKFGMSNIIDITVSNCSPSFVSK